MPDFKTHNIGDFLKRARIERGVTQTRLSEGLCNVSTLSRIERGLIAPAYGLFQSLIERLGYYSDSWRSLFWNYESYQTDHRKNSLIMAMISKDAPTMERLLAEYEKKGYANALERQFMLTSKVSLAVLKDKEDGNLDFQLSMRQIRESIAITNANFREEKIRDYMLTSEEIRAINIIGGIYFCHRDYEDAARILLALKDNLDKFCPNIYEKARHYPSILKNLAVMYYKLGQYNKGVAICETGRDFCLECNCFVTIPALQTIHGKCLAELGNKTGAKPILFEAYYSARALGRFDEIDDIFEYYFKTFDKKIENDCLEDAPTGHDPAQETGHENNNLERLLSALGNGAASTKELMSRLGLKHRQTFRDNYLLPALANGFVEMTIPDRPSDKRQRYRAVR